MAIEWRLKFGNRSSSLGDLRGAFAPPPPSRTCYYPDPSGARVKWQKFKEKYYLGVGIGESYLFATLPDLQPPHLEGNWWWINDQNTCQKVGHIRLVRSNPIPSSHVSGGQY